MSPSSKNPAAVALAKRGAAKAAERLAARAAQMTAQERSELASLAATCRWGRRRATLDAVADLMEILVRIAETDNPIILQRCRELAAAIRQRTEAASPPPPGGQDR